MKLTLALLTVVLPLTAMSADPVATATPAAEATPVTGKGVQTKMKKNLRHMGENIEKLGDKAGKKMGVKNISTPTPTPEQAH